MTTHEIEQMFGITKQTLIYYEKEGMINPKRNENNYRNYSSGDIDVLRLILLLRSMGVSIDEIKLILDEKLSIRKALETKKDFINKEKIELESVEQNINKYIQRKKVNIVFNNENIHNCKWDNHYIDLNILDNRISFLDVEIHKNEIIGIDISLCNSKRESNMYFNFYNLYFVDLDIHTRKDSYSFQLMNNSKVNDLFDFLLEQNMIVNDPMNIIDIYKTYQDPVELNKYINQHFREWAKMYHLDNPLENYYTHIQNDYIKPLEDFKKGEVPTVKGQFKELFQYFWDSLKKK